MSKQQLNEQNTERKSSHKMLVSILENEVKKSKNSRNTFSRNMSL